MVYQTPRLTDAFLETTYLCSIAQIHLCRGLLLEISHKRRFPLRRMKQDGRGMQKHAPAGLACTDVIEFVLLCFVRALNATSLDAVELDGAGGQVYAGDARPETCKDDSFDEASMRAMCI